ncbi:MAG: ABC transporter ATP-binding protein [Ahrensia sp.]|nr:ABC transporter ATP-binding protein [Ahrensia sp.]
MDQDDLQIRDIGGDIIAILKRIYQENGRDYRGAYLFMVACLLVISATTAFIAWIMRDVIDGIFYQQREDLVALITLTIMRCFYVCAVLAMYLHAITMARIGNDLVARYQTRIFSKLMHMGVGFFNDNRSGHMAAQISQNISGIRDVMSLTVTSLARDLVTLVGLVAVMFLQDTTLSLITFILGPILLLGVAYISRKVRSVVRQTIELNSRVIGSMQEAMQGITVVKAFTMETQLTERISGIILDARTRADRLAIISERVIPMTEVVAGFSVAGAIAFGGYRAIYEQQPPGAMFAFITALLLAYDPAQRLARLKVNLERAMVNARMIYEIIDMEDVQPDMPSAPPLEVTAGKIVFDNVDFNYGDGARVLNGLCFTAESHQTTALVGPSGAGKSTVISLIQRFFDPSAGSITIDGQPINQVTKQSLRQKIAYVSQQPYLFEGSILQNIRYGRPDASDEEIHEAAKLANAHDFILEQSQGYDTPVGENGVTLSGGQRQRLSIARAILRDAPILLLDEATSALDNESERLVQEALEKVMRGRTTIVVAHRLSTVVDAHKIVVIDNGIVVESGTHQELSSREDGLYAKFNQLSTMTTPKVS